MDGELEAEGSREYRERLSQEIAKLGETKEEIFKGAQLRHLAIPVGIVGSQTTWRTIAGGRKENVYAVGVQITNLPLARF